MVSSAKNQAYQSPGLKQKLYAEDIKTVFMPEKLCKSIWTIARQHRRAQK